MLGDIVSGVREASARVEELFNHHREAFEQKFYYGVFVGCVYE